MSVCVCGCEPRSGRGRLTRRKSQTPLRRRERAPCHNLCLKKHEFFSAQWQRWHFMFATIISLVNDSCGCDAYESFREQTETLVLRALSFFTGCCSNIQTECRETQQTVSVGIITQPASCSLFASSDLFSRHLEEPQPEGQVTPPFITPGLCGSYNSSRWKHCEVSPCQFW